MLPEPGDRWGSNGQCRGAGRGITHLVEDQARTWRVLQGAQRPKHGDTPAAIGEADLASCAREGQTAT